MKNKSLIIAGIVLSLMIVLSIGTYAYWTITRSQEGENTLIGACLSIDISEEGETISLDKAWPISDFEGMQLEGYTFKVTNDCEEPQDYRIDLDRLVDSEGRKEMSNEYLTTLLDYGVPVVYSELETGESTEEGIQEKRVLAYDTVMGGETNEHTLRLWIDESSPVTEQGSAFLSKVKINAGQGIEKYYTPEECFTFDSANGSITAYDETKVGCTTDVVIPYEIGEVAVTEIERNAFYDKGITSVEFPRSIEIIEKAAFRLNPSIEKIIFKDGLNNIGIDAFCSDYSAPFELGKLEFINFPKTLTFIDAKAFMSNNIKTLVIPDNVTYIGPQAFSSNHIKELKFGTGLTTLDVESFRENDIENVVIPDNVTEIFAGAFFSNPLKSIVLGKNLERIEGFSFANSNYLNQCFYYENPKKCYSNENYLSEVFIPANVITIGRGAFETATSDVIIRTERTKEDFLNTFTQENLLSIDKGIWYGDAQVISSDGLNIYE